MRFGTKVLVERGGHSRPPGTPGSFRLVPGVLVGARGHDRFVRLLVDDPLAIAGWTKAGQVGCWPASSLRKERS